MSEGPPVAPATPGPFPPQPSVVDPINPAVDRVAAILFRPFDLRTWLVVGFAAFLARLGTSGSNFNFPTERLDPVGPSDPVGAWFAAHIAAVIVIVLVVLALAVALVWLSSRGKFVFLEAVLHNRAAIVEPWKRHAALAGSLFRFRLLLGVALLAGLIALGLVAWIAFGGFDFDGAGSGQKLAMVLAALAVTLPMALVVGLLGMALDDLVVPLMYLRGQPVVAAWRELGRLVAAGPGTFVRYALLRVVIALAGGVIALGVIVFTCCVAALPYVGTVILLPLFVFVRAYPLHFLAQLGPDYRRFDRLGAGPDEVAEVFA